MRYRLKTPHLAEFAGGAILVFMVLLMLGIVAAIAYPEPMTHDQVVATVKTEGLDWAAEWIASVYTATPVVTVPHLLAVVTDRDVGVSIEGPVSVSIDGKLAYDLTLGPWKFSGVVPRINPWQLVWSGAAGFGVGVLATLATLALSGHLK